ncbi:MULTISPECIES: TrkH family potassium uptake protein [unclassified Exiguobacterium]|uniref:TrkH family potassium uptake protein n=1 Tax=unclassified Exiguobacterium TaxID=2644629 RepID=UPI00103CB7D2|nr:MULTISPECIES: potassium transporter TrkG [unclassified Exiguobacterium]TCI44346.1 potassium transporter Trk [Exiguobacterium sp. SH5S32]TCI50610.1 potassium transporter Trk [Exiguobacterium sp. SH1S4]TCI69570.1 potassium transporter Trk [Exiguobacterium sp. SH1S1]
MRHRLTVRELRLKRIEALYRLIFEKPARFIATGFLLAILIGATLLYMPFAQTEPVSWIDCLFIATSAGTVTGLSTIDIGSSFNTFGELVIVALIQIGGLGFMTVALMLLSVLGKKIGLKQRILLQESLNLSGPGGTVRLVRNIVFTTIIVQFIGMLFLTVELYSTSDYRFGEALYYGFFHAVSAFNNAGFALWPDSLMQFEQNTAIVVTISMLLMIGGLGFTTIADATEVKRWKRLALHSKIMIASLGVINGIAWFGLMLFEWVSVEGALYGRPIGEALNVTFFQAVTTRTAGFNTVDISMMAPVSIGLILILMYIGAGAASTGSGIKVTTVAVILADMWAFIAGKKETVILERTIDAFQIKKAYVVAISSFFFILLITALTILTNDHIPATALLFETVSAFGTVGLSLGITAELNDAGKGFIMFMMLLGRVGSLTILFTVARQMDRKIRYPKEKLLIG